MTRWVGVSQPVDAKQRRVVLDRALVAEPQQRAAVIAQRVVTPRGATPRPKHRPSAPTTGVYFGTFFCMNGVLAAQHPDHRERPARPAAGTIRSATGVEVVDQVALGRARIRRTAAGRGWSATPHRVLRRSPAYPPTDPGGTREPPRSSLRGCLDCLPGGTDQQTSPVSIQHGKAIRQYARRAVAPIGSRRPPRIGRSISINSSGNFKAQTGGSDWYRAGREAFGKGEQMPYHPQHPYPAVTASATPARPAPPDVPPTSADFTFADDFAGAVGSPTPSRRTGTTSPAKDPW